jgi:hypothetical protein
MRGKCAPDTFDRDAELPDNAVTLLSIAGDWGSTYFRFDKVDFQVIYLIK